MTVIVNQRIDAMTTTLDRERAALALTNGEALAWVTLAMAGLLKQMADREALTLAIDFLLYHVSGKDENAREAWQALLKTCSVEQDPQEQSDGYGHGV